MSPTATKLTALPLFPLQAVLFPGGALALRVFEVRYLDMIGSRHKAGEPFGVVCLSEGSETRAARAARPMAAPRATASRARRSSPSARWRASPGSSAPSRA